jgi:SAM-dependent methyltransferase
VVLEVPGPAVGAHVVAEGGPEVADRGPEHPAQSAAQAARLLPVQAAGGPARVRPGSGRRRREAVAGVDRDPGDVVGDRGGGTGGNLAYLRDAVGPSGVVVGVDLTRGMLDRARALVEAEEWANVHVVQGDARTIPVRGRVDGVLASFVVGMLDDPASAVHTWCDVVARSDPDSPAPTPPVTQADPEPAEPRDAGTVVLVDAALSDRRVAAPVNAAFRALTVLSTPPTFKLRYESSPHDRLRERIQEARNALAARSTATVHREHLLGIVRVTGGQLDRSVTDSAK